ncbi:MAG: phosphoesterase RecJ domain-containing protein [Clostridiales bacterium]|nr:phosphoesterase RecJ domain-containing protein [Clostridiales bacterium]
MSIKETADYLQTLDHVLILTHIRPDGDTIGSASALCRALRNLGKEAFLLPNSGITATYAPYAAPYWAPEGYRPAHVVSTDIADLALLPENAEPYRDHIELAIDHHPSYSGFGKTACVVPEAAAAGEILYAIIREMTPVTKEIALPLYVAVSTDTGCFVYANTTAQTHWVAAALIETGIDYRTVNKVLFRTKSKTRLAMEARMVSQMELYDNDRIVVMQIPLSLRDEMHATEADIEELSSLAALVEGTDCGITIRELAPGENKISVRTGPRINATAACAVLGGGGHRAAAGATVRGTMEETKKAILKAVLASAED